MSPHEIKVWLKETGKNREWLALQCGVSKRTVDGWLNSRNPRPIPQPALRVIRGLRMDSISINPTLSVNDYREIQLLAFAAGKSVEELIAQLIKDYVANSQKCSRAAEEPPDYGPPDK